MSKNGGGVGIYLGNVRGAKQPISNGGGETTGITPVAGIYDTIGGYVSQSGVRRGAFAFYLPIDHPDVRDLLETKNHFGDPRSYIDSNIALTVPDSFMERVKSGEEEACNLWSKVLETQMKSGSPYLMFIDNVNKANPKSYDRLNLTVKTSNICSEITLHTDEDHSFVCCLSSLNLAFYDQWQRWVGQSGYNLVNLGVLILDAVMEEFIIKAKKIPSMGRSVRFAEKSRALGLGVMGVHYYYQKKGWPFKSYEARQFNKKVFEAIHIDSKIMSTHLGGIMGEPEWCQGTGRRNSHLLALAPTRSNSVITNAYSAGIEPLSSNIFVAKEAKGSFVRKNKVLEELLELRGCNTEEVWDSISAHNGSVMNLDCLSFDEKMVFLTAREISQMELIRQAAERQPFIDQAQSLNRFYHPDTPVSEINRQVFAAWANGVKTLYYTKSSSDSTIKRVKDKATIITKEACPYCVKAKDLMTKLGINYDEVPRESVNNFPFKTVPQIWFQGHYVGGYDQFAELISVQRGRQVGAFDPGAQEDCESCSG